MRGSRVLVASVIAGLALVLVAISISSASADESSIERDTAPLAPAATITVTSTADSGPGTLRQALTDAVNGDVIGFDTGVFPPSNPQTITITSGELPAIKQGNLTIDASNAGVILDGSGIGTPETVLVDDVSLTLDGGPNQITNGDFGAGLGHWRPCDELVGATRSLNTGDYHSSPSSYEWNVVAHVGESCTVYDITDTSDPIDDPFDSSTVWITATGDSTVEVRFWYRYAGPGVHLEARLPDYTDGMGDWWFDWQADWTEAVVSVTLPSNAVGVAFELDHRHSQRWDDGLISSSSGNVIRGLQVVNFPHSGIVLDGAQYNVVGGDNTIGAAPLGQGNLISGNGGYGIELEDNSTMSNTVSGNYIGTDLSGTTAVGNLAIGVSINGDASYNLIGGTNGSPGGACTGACNLISGNGRNGVSIGGGGAVSNTVSGNYIGTDVSGTVAVGNGDNGVSIGGDASNNTVGGSATGEGNLISGNANIGVSISGSGTMSNTVKGNYIGVDASGTAALGNTSNGVFINDGAHHNVVGGTTAAERNIVSGQGQGIHIMGGHANMIVGNYIGTDASGTVALGNHYGGILISHGAQHNIVGGSTAGERNLISGNNADGIKINGIGTMSNTVSGNYIGTDVNGTSALGNDRGGVEIRDGASDNLIGGDTAAERNLISGNSNVGVFITGSTTTNNTVSGNYIGTDASGTSALSMGGFIDGVDIGDGASGNVIGGDNGTPGVACTGECNLISGNSGDGIWLEDAGAANIVSGNYIGTDASGDSALGNGYSGVFVSGSTSNCTIGGDTPGERNLISGNDGGVGIVGASYITVSGNYIGTDASGTAAIGNFGAGVGVSGDNNLIGGVNTTPGSGCGGACNLISGNTNVGVSISGSGTVSNTVSGNYIGTDVSGTAALPNNSVGVRIYDSASYNLVGGDTPGERNLISGNGTHGVQVEWGGTTYNTIMGNYIGTDVHGAAALPNGEAGVEIDDSASYNVIGGDNGTPGGACTGACNLISGNDEGGMVVSDYSMNNTVSGNYIGTDASGALAIGNARGGVEVSNGASENLIGGDTLGEGNVIAHNGGGIVVDGAATLGNTVSHNSIYANAAEGIGLTNGGNGELAAPSITGIAGTTVTGQACANCTVEVFSDDDDEGRWFHGTTTADGSGTFIFTSTIPFTGTTVTATATDADGSTSEFSPPPSVTSIAPIQGTNDVPNEINVYGLDFVEGLSVTLHTTPTTDLSVSYLNSSHLRATVPISLTAGSYDLTVTNPDGRSDTLANAYTVFDAQGTDDLYAQSHDLWNNPLTVRQGEQAGLGLVVHRQGGDETLTDVVVHFYDGDPDLGGTFIFTGTIAQLAPRSSESTTEAPWTPTSAGDYTIYARIDPGDAVTETVETNNTVSTTITVLPQAIDTTPPTVTAFAINGGADVTAVPTVTLTVSAEDDAGGSGIGTIRFVEFEFVQAAMQWVPVQSSDWLSYTTSYTWTLIDVAGARYMQVWVADKAGNISLSPAKDQINYTPPSDQIAQEQVRIYRQYVEAGQTLSVTVTPLSGDPDLYIWSPAGSSAGVSNNYTDTVDALSVEVAVSGTYQIEVYGYTAAEYTISITVIEDGAGSMPDARDIWLASPSSKVPRSEPVVPVENEPPGQMAVPTAPVTGDTSKVYLPLVLRNY